MALRDPDKHHQIVQELSWCQSGISDAPFKVETIARTRNVYQKSWQRPQTMNKIREIGAISVLDGFGIHSKPTNRSTMFWIEGSRFIVRLILFCFNKFIRFSYIPGAAGFVVLSTVFVFHHFFGMEEISMIWGISATWHLRWIFYEGNCRPINLCGPWICSENLFRCLFGVRCLCLLLDTRKNVKSKPKPHSSTNNIM